MNLDADGANCRVPTLVQLCQRVCVSSIDSISSLGNELRYELVRPILERCDAEQLLRLEESSPHLENDTQEIWKELCYTAYPLAIERYSMGPEDHPRSWKDHYFFLKEAEAQRLEEASAKLRTQRLVAEERKREREVKITDRLPPPKRQRTSAWASTSAPKTLFQKTRSDASKLQRNMFNHIVPPMPRNGKTFTVLPKPSAANMEFLPPSTSGTTRVTVNNVVRRLPCTSAGSCSSVSNSMATVLSQTEKQLAVPSPSVPSPVGKSPAKRPTSPPIRVDPSTPSEPRPLKPPGHAKKDPMASLFVPKRRAHSQLP